MSNGKTADNLDVTDPIVNKTKTENQRRIDSIIQSVREKYYREYGCYPEQNGFGKSR